MVTRLAFAFVRLESMESVFCLACLISRAHPHTSTHAPARSRTPLCLSLSPCLHPTSHALLSPACLSLFSQSALAARACPQFCRLAAAATLVRHVSTLDLHACLHLPCPVRVAYSPPLLNSNPDLAPQFGCPALLPLLKLPLPLSALPRVLLRTGRAVSFSPFEPQPGQSANTRRRLRLRHRMSVAMLPFSTLHSHAHRCSSRVAWHWSAGALS